MNISLEQRARTLFDQAIELDEHSRMELLTNVRKTDAAAAEEVEALLACHERTRSILDCDPATFLGASPFADAVAGSEPDDDEQVSLPATLGNYTLQRIIGQGGMGVVYEAQQASPRRSVAIKLIRPELLTSSIIRRFEHEAEVLGMVDHPNIARVYEAGQARLNGMPRSFIAMELVRGLPLNEYVRQRHLSNKERISLFADICDAVQAAHRRGVIHRDLKPANIVVGDDGKPRILDFGVARLATSSQNATLMTRSGQIIGTLAYMSPEQALGDQSAVDTRSDIYSLGALLFELLAGAPPIDVSDKSLQSALGAIQLTHPQLSREQRRLLGRDTEAVILHALEKDPDRRYQHASELAADLRRLLRGEAITARTPTVIDQFTRFYRRNRELVAAGLLVTATLLMAVGATSAALLRERHARAAAVEHAQEAADARDEAIASARIAQESSERSRAVVEFMRTILSGIRPAVAQGRDTTLLRVVLEESERSLPRLDQQPLAKADSHGVLGDSYRSLGDYEKAELHYAAAAALFGEHLGEGHRATAVSIHNLGALYRGSLRRYAEAEPLLRRAAELLIELDDDDDTDIRNSQSSLALLFLDTGRPAEAEPVLRDLRLRIEAAEGLDSAATYRAMHNHASALSMLGRIEEARQLGQAVFEGRARLHGDDHPSTVTSMLFVAIMHHALGHLEKALPLIRRVVEIRQRVYGDQHQATLAARQHLVALLRDLGKLEESLALAEAVHSSSAAALGERHLETLRARMFVIELRIVLGRCEGAGGEADQIAAAVADNDSPAAIWNALAAMVRGMALACEGQIEPADVLLQQAYFELEAAITPHHRVTQRAAEVLAWFYHATNRPDDAAMWEARSRLRPR